MTVTSRSLRTKLLISASIGSLLFAGVAAAQDRSGGRISGGRGGADPAAAAARAAQAQATQQAQASSASQRAIDAFRRAAETRRQMQDAQIAARAAARLTQSNIPNGLGQGGLQVANGVELDPSLWIGANGPAQSQDEDGRTNVSIDQTQQRAILTWDSFNVGRETDLTFNQAGADWVALNRVTDVNADPSRILGSIKADGSVYIINRNGIIFGGASQVNVRNLVASTANITNDDFLNSGIYSSLSGNNYVPSFADAGGAVTVEAGAQINTHTPQSVTAGGGYVLLMGTEVTNAGSITTPKGQTLLAAGDDFIIRRGYGTEENQNSTTRGNEVRGLIDTESASGTVTNSGLIEAAQGDTTLTGRTVHQDGVAVATTSVNQRGTIHLLNSASDADGSVTLGAESLTTILPELDSEDTALDSQRAGMDIPGGVTDPRFDNLGSFPSSGSQSLLEIVSGGDVLFSGGSTTAAQGGQIIVSAAGQITAEDGAAIDVSGVQGVALDMESNSILVNVQGNELRDSPLNRDEANLKSQDIWIDVRDLILLPAGTGGYESDRWYTPGGLLEVGGYLANREIGIGEWAAVGGTIALSANEVVAHKGATFDISGGSLDYRAGWVRSTRVMGADGKLYDIGQAPAGMRMVAYGNAFTREHDRWGEKYAEVYSHPLFSSRNSVRWEEGYTVGRDAGRLLLAAPTAQFEAEIIAEVFSGSRQTNSRSTGVSDSHALPQDVAPLSGTLVIARNLSSGAVGSDTKVIFGGLAPSPEDRTGTSWFDSATLNGFGLGGLQVNSTQSVEVLDPLILANGGQVEFSAPVIDISADITARGGALSFDNSSYGSNGTIITLGEGSILDVRGVWTNLQIDREETADLAYVDGGRVTMRSSGALILADGSLIDASSGAALLPDGTMLGGRGGDVTLISDYRTPEGGGGMVLDGDIRAFGITGGGTLIIQTARAIAVGDNALLADGVLSAGTAAPMDLDLAEDVVIPAGGTVPAAFTYVVNTVPAGQPLAQPVQPAVGSGLRVASDWTVPSGYSLGIYTAAGYHGEGAVIPAGAIITNWLGTLPAGFVVPADVFPQGLPIPARTVQIAAGETPIDVVIPAGVTVSTGTRFEQAIRLAQPLDIASDRLKSGFAHYDIRGGRGLLVQSGASVDVEMPVYRLTTRSFDMASGADPASVLELWTPPAVIEDAVNGVMTQRAGASLTLAASVPGATPASPTAGGLLTLGRGATINVDAGQDVSLEARGQITIEGSIIARGGEVTIVDTQLGAERRNGSYDTGNQSIWLGEASRIDVSGQSWRALDQYGDAYGLLLDGGSVLIGSEKGEESNMGLAPSTQAFIIQRPGSVIDASGASLAVDVRRSNTSNASDSRLLASNGGTIAFNSSTGIFLDGDLIARSGGEGATGGLLSLNLETPVYGGVGTTIDPAVLPDALNRMRIITVAQEQGGSQLGAGLVVGGGDAGLTAGARIGVDRIEAGGFDGLTLAARDLITFEGDISLHLGRSLELSGVISAGTNDLPSTVDLSAPYLLLSGFRPVGSPSSGQDYFAGLAWGPLAGSWSNQYRGSESTVAGSRLTLSAAHIDVRGNVLFGVSGRQGVRPGSGAIPNAIVDAAGFADVDLVSSGDIRFMSPDNPSTGLPIPSHLASGGNLSLTAAQLYPATNAVAMVTAGHASGLTSNQLVSGHTLSIHSNSTTDPALPYSVFGSLSLVADIIEQGGVVRAPLGLVEIGTSSNINLSPRPFASEVRLLPGSITSVSAAGLVMPFGGTTDGQRYYYGGVEYTLTASGSLRRSDGQGVTDARTVLLGGAKVSIEEGAVLDLSGGGDLLGAAFVTGRGGSIDVLQAPLAAAGPGHGLSSPGNAVYAIVPGYAGVAPAVPDAGGGTPQLGQQITLTESLPGLPAGTYMLLPATFATVPGAYRVEVGAADPRLIRSNGVHRLDTGSYVTGARFGIANIGIIDATPSRVILTPSQIVRTLSGYNETGYAAFTANQAATFGRVDYTTPVDAGWLKLDLGRVAADRPLVVLGEVRMEAGEGGRGGTADLLAGNPGAPPIEIRSGEAAASEGYVSLVDSDLNALSANTLLINGMLVTGDDGRLAFSGASYGSVTLRSGSTLSAPQVLVVSSDSILMEAGATIDTRGQGAASLSVENGFTIGFRSAFLGVSNGGIDARVGSGLEGSLILDDGAILRSEGSIALAASEQLTIGAVYLDARDLNFALEAINIGDADDLASAAANGVLPPGWTLTQQMVDQLLRPSAGGTQLERLTLTARDSLNLFGSVELSTIDPATGQSSVELALVTPAIYGLGADTDVATISTGRLIWNGRMVSTGTNPDTFGSGAPGPVLPGGAGTGAGRLALVADEIVFGFNPQERPQDEPDIQRLALGFSTVDVIAAQRITANNKGTLNVYRDGADATSHAGGDLNLVTPLLTGAPGSTIRFNAGGSINIAAPVQSAVVDTSAITDLGGEIHINVGGALSLDTSVALPSGRLVLNAAGDIALGERARVDLSGRALGFFDVERHGWGGTLVMESADGAITQAADSVIDVSAANSDAGSITAIALGANGAVDLAGSLLGHGGAGRDLGGIDVRGRVLGDFAGLNETLDAGGFFGARAFRLGTGDLIVGDELRANHVSITVDGGSLTVNGKIDASGARPGAIYLVARDDLTLASGAVLDVHATDLHTDSYGAPIEASNRGRVQLTASEGAVTLVQGATLDLRSADSIARGKVEINAPRLGGVGGSGAGAADVAVHAGGALDVLGAASIAVNGWRAYTPADGIIDQGLLDVIHGDSSAFIDAALANGAMASRLAGLSAYGDAFHLRPGVEINSAEDLTVQGDLDLSGYRYGPNADPALQGSGEAGVIALRAAGDLTINGSISDGFAPPPSTPDDNRWGLMLPTGLLSNAVTVTVAGVTLRANSRLPTVGSVNFDFMLSDYTDVRPNGVLPSDLAVAYAYLPANTKLTASIHDAGGVLLYSAGTVLESALELFGGETLGAGFNVGPDGYVSLASTLWPAGAPLDIFSNVYVGANTALPAGAVLPAGANVNYVGSAFVSTRPTGPDGTQGKIYAVAPMLAPGSQSWSIGLTSGADIASADTRALSGKAALEGRGNLTLSDMHFSGPTGANQAPSVIRTGTGDLELRVGGSYAQESLFGVYTAGSQSADILPQHRPEWERAADGTLLGSAFSAYADALTVRQAWYPEHGGDLTVAVQGNMIGHTLNIANGPVTSDPGNWLWRQGGAGIGQDTAWWINFGSYMNRAPNQTSAASATLLGFTGFGALGGGNVSLKVGGDAGVLVDGGSGSRQASGIDVAIGGTGRVFADGRLLQTGGGDLRINIDGALNPAGAYEHTANSIGFLNGVITNLRGDTDIAARSIGRLGIDYGWVQTNDPRPVGDEPAMARLPRGGIYLALGDSAASLRTRGDLVLGTVLDPGRQRANATSAPVPEEVATSANVASWFTLWTDRSAVDLFSAGGDLTPNTIGDPRPWLDDRAFYYPGTLRAVAGGGNIYGRGMRSTGRPLELAPFANAAFELLAQGSVYGNGELDGGALIFAISGADPQSLATPLNPAYQLYQRGTPGTTAAQLLGNNAWDGAGPIGELFRYGTDNATGFLHADNPNPARVYAVAGDIEDFRFGYSYVTAWNGSAFLGNPASFDLASGTPLSLRAGRDIVSFGSPVLLSGSGQARIYRSTVIVHGNPLDVSTIQAGRDIFFANVTIAGPGVLDISAGRNIYQAGRGTLHSIGPIGNQERVGERGGGAGISVAAGIGANGPAYADFARLYLDGVNLADPERPLTDQAGKVAKTYADELAGWLGDRYGWTEADDEALDYFLALAPEQQAIFLRDVYFEELRQGGREYNDADGRRFGSYLRGRQAISTLFPENDASGNALHYAGDFTMFGERGIQFFEGGGFIPVYRSDLGTFDLDGAILTDFGGDVQVMTPGGGLTIGVDGIQPAARSGLLTQGSGDIEVFTHDNILLGLSRVFTTFGGGITMWSAEGDINAGRGAKTTVVHPPARRVYDQYGNVTLSPTAPTSGAGIGTLNPIPEVPPGDIDLIAPLGTIDAGEAGIRVSGNINLAALQVLNAANIQVQGDAVGVPMAVVVNTGALTAASSASSAVAAQAANLAERSRPQPIRDIPAIVNVRFVGFGE